MALAKIKLRDASFSTAAKIAHPAASGKRTSGKEKGGRLTHEKGFIEFIRGLADEEGMKLWMWASLTLFSTLNAEAHRTQTPLELIRSLPAPSAATRAQAARRIDCSAAMISLDEQKEIIRTALFDAQEYQGWWAPLVLKAFNTRVARNFNIQIGENARTRWIIAGDMSGSALHQAVLDQAGLVLDNDQLVRGLALTTVLAVSGVYASSFLPESLTKNVVAGGIVLTQIGKVFDVLLHQADARVLPKLRKYVMGTTERTRPVTASHSDLESIALREKSIYSETAGVGAELLGETEGEITRKIQMIVKYLTVQAMGTKRGKRIALDVTDEDIADLFASVLWQMRRMHAELKANDANLQIMTRPVIRPTSPAFFRLESQIMERIRSFDPQDFDTQAAKEDYQLMIDTWFRRSPER